MKDHNKLLISWGKCKEGAKLCLVNADRLVNDSVILYKRKRFSSSSCLALYALEEIGKGNSILKSFNNKEDITEKIWLRLRGRHSHKTKLEIGKILAQTHMEERFKKYIKPLEKEKMQIGINYMADFDDKRKQSYLYVDVVGNDWASPTQLNQEVLEVLAIITITESKEACLALAIELGESTGKLNRECNSLGKLFFKNMEHHSPFMNSPLKRS